MAILSGIPLNQPVPKVGRLTKLGVYLGVAGISLALVATAMAFILRRPRSEAAAKAKAQATAPATGALKSLEREWGLGGDKTPQPVATSSTKPAVPVAASYEPSQSPLVNPAYFAQQPLQRPPGYMTREEMLRNQMAMPPQPGYPSTGSTPLAQPVAPIDPMDEQRKIWDAPMVASQASAPAAQPPLPYAVPPVGPTAAGIGYPEHREPRGNGDESLNQNMQDSKKSFAGVGIDKSGIILAAAGEISPYTVRAGVDMWAILEQGASSDLPGELRARVLENVRDTATGKYILIPQNAILLGKYNSDIAYGQNRIQTNWDRLQRSGKEPTIFLNHMNGLDPDGSAGLSGHVDNHFKRLIGFALLSSAFAAGIQVSQNRNNSGNYGYPSSGEMAGAAVGQQMGEFGRKVTERNLNRPPTIKIDVGKRFPVRVDRDIVFGTAYMEK